MKKTLLVIMMAFLLIGCSCEGAIFGTNIPEINNTSQQELLFMDKQLFLSKINVWDDFVVLELPKDVIENYETNSNQYLTWLEAGVCAIGTNYECSENIDIVKSRLQIYYGDVNELKHVDVNKINGSTPALNFYLNRKMVKSITLSSLENTVSDKSLERRFRDAIIDNIEYKKLNLGKLKYFKSVGPKIIPIDKNNLVEVTKAGETYKEYQKILDLTNSTDPKENNFILLITSILEPYQNYHIFSDRFYSIKPSGRYDKLPEDNLNDKENIPTNICNTSSSNGYGPTYCSLYNLYLTNIANANGFPFYHINITDIEQQHAIERHVFLMGSPSISIFIDGREETSIIGNVNKKYIENELFKLGVLDKNLDFTISCDLESDETCTYVGDLQHEKLEIETIDFVSSFNLSFSDLINAKYFISDVLIEDIDTVNYDTYYLEASLDPGFKDTFEYNEESLVFDKLVEVDFVEAKKYYTYVYSQDISNNKGIKTFEIEIIEKIVEDGE